VGDQSARLDFNPITVYEVKNIPILKDWVKNHSDFTPFITKNSPYNKNYVTKLI
jgi:hypothetical protein